MLILVDLKPMTRQLPCLAVTVGKRNSYGKVFTKGVPVGVNPPGEGFPASRRLKSRCTSCYLWPNFNLHGFSSQRVCQPRRQIQLFETKSFDWEIK